MSRLNAQQPLVSSLLDRLIDSEPTDSAEAEGRSCTVRQLREAVRRDLEELLNTRQIRPDLADSSGELATSLLTYGLPDLSSWGKNVGDDRTRLCRMVEHAIKMFEPRLELVEVSMDEPMDKLSRTVKLTISGILHVEPLREPVAFDTKVETDNGTFDVQSEA